MSIVYDKIKYYEMNYDIYQIRGRYSSIKNKSWQIIDGKLYLMKANGIIVHNNEEISIYEKVFADWVTEKIYLNRSIFYLLEDNEYVDYNYIDIVDGIVQNK